MHPSKKMSPEWADLPADLLVTIATLLTSVFDFLAFRGVCKSWRSAVTLENFDNSIPQLPWLMFMSADENLVTNPVECKKTIKFMDVFNNRRVFNRTMYTPPEYELGTKFFSSGSWLLGIKEDTIKLELIHVIRGTRLGLPGLDTFPGFDTWYLYDRHDYSHFIELDNYAAMKSCRPRCFIKKMVVVRSLPGTSSDNNFVVVVIWGEQNQLAFSRPGDSIWTVFDSWDESFCDVICHNGIVYALDFDMRIVSCNINGEVPTKLQLVVTFDDPDDYDDDYDDGGEKIPQSMNHLVFDSFSGKIIIVNPCVDDEETWAQDYNYMVSSRVKFFLRFECDMSSGNGFNVTYDETGNKALFLGFNSSMCLQLPTSSEAKNCIYFTDTQVYTHLYMHVYHLRENQTGIYRRLQSRHDCTPYRASGEAYVAPLLWVLPGL